LSRAYTEDMEKTALRSHMLKSRQAMTGTEALSRSITERLLGWNDLADARKIHIYRSRPGWREVDTARLINHIAGAMPTTSLVIGDVSRTAQLPDVIFDVIIVPLLAFDADGRRLGLGGGWYDRFLANQPQALTIGLAYEAQRVATVPTEPHDMPLDAVVTEAAIYR